MRNGYWGEATIDTCFSNCRLDRVALITGEMWNGKS